MSQVEVPKTVAYAGIGPQSDEIAVPKTVMYVLLRPGDGDDGQIRQSSINVQILPKRGS